MIRGWLRVKWLGIMYDGDDVYLKKITTRVSQNLILQNANQPKA
jgi:hypothetical protein